MTATLPIRILLVDDHALVRAGIRSLLERDNPGAQIVEADSAEDALARFDAFEPALVLLDITLGGMNGLDAAKEMLRRRAHCRVMMLSMHHTIDLVQRALHLGVAGYLLKDAAPTELQLAVSAVLRGEVYLSPAVSRQVVSSYLPPNGKNAGDGAREPLTARQREILTLIATGLATRDIAARLGVSVKTIEGARVRIMNKLQIFDVPGLVLYALRHGLISDDPRR